MKLSLGKDEAILKEGSSDRVSRTGLSKLRGHLWLTNRRLVFRSAALLKQYEVSFWLQDIVSVQPMSTLGLIPDLIFLTLQHDEQETFVVLGQQDWLAKIAGAKSQLSPEAALVPEPAPGADTGRPAAVAAPAPPPHWTRTGAAWAVGIGALFLAAIALCVCGIFVWSALASR